MAERKMRFFGHIVRKQIAWPKRLLHETEAANRQTCKYLIPGYGRLYMAGAPPLACDQEIWREIIIITAWHAHGAIWLEGEREKARERERERERESERERARERELVIGTVSVPHRIADWTIIVCIFPLTCGGTPLSHRTPDIFLQLFHLHCILLFTSVFKSPSLYTLYHTMCLVVYLLSTLCSYVWLIGSSIMCRHLPFQQM